MGCGWGWGDRFENGWVVGRVGEMGSWGGGGWGKLLLVLTKYRVLTLNPPLILGVGLATSWEKSCY